jgi:hypothetical protein
VLPLKRAKMKPRRAQKGRTLTVESSKVSGKFVPLVPQRVRHPYRRSPTSSALAQ